MKHLCKIVLIAVCSLSAVTITTSPASASARHPKSSQASFEGSPAWQKLDLRLREAWRVSAKEGGGKNVFECLLKTDHPLAAAEQSTLKAAGFEARTFIGAIATGRVAVLHVPDVAALPFVSAMELAVPLELKKP